MILNVVLILAVLYLLFFNFFPATIDAYENGSLKDKFVQSLFPLGTIILLWHLLNNIKEAREEIREERELDDFSKKNNKHNNATPVPLSINEKQKVDHYLKVLTDFNLFNKSQKEYSYFHKILETADLGDNDGEHLHLGSFVDVIAEALEEADENPK